MLPEGSDIGAFHRTFTDIHARLRDGPYRPYTQLLQQALLEAMTHMLDHLRRFILKSAVRCWLDGLCGAVLVGFGARLALARQ